MTPRRPVAPLALSLALLAGTAAAQEAMPPVPAAAEPAENTNRDERALEILEAARDQFNEFKTVTFSASSEIVAESGPLSAFKLGAEGTIWARREDTGRWTRAMVGQADDIGASEPVSFHIIKKDLEASWIDHEKQEVVHAVGRYAKGKIYGSAELLGVDLLFSGNPYATELNASKLEFVGTENVEGTLCDVVRAEYGGRSLAKRWFIASGDKFPRRVVEELMEGAERIYDFSQVQIDTEIEASRFELEVPKTYTEVNLPERRTAVNAPVGSDPIVADPNTEPGQIYGSAVGDNGTPFTAEDIFGTSYNSEDYLGKPLVLFFWASWLPNTPATIDDMFAIQDHLGDDGKLLTLALRERQPENASNIILDKNRDDVVVITNGGRVGGAYNVARVPVVIVLDKDGKIVYRNEDYNASESIDEVLKLLDALKG